MEPDDLPCSQNTHDENVLVLACSEGSFSTIPKEITSELGRIVQKQEASHTIKDFALGESQYGTSDCKTHLHLFKTLGSGLETRRF